MPSKNVDESVSETQIGHATSPVIDPTKHILSMTIPNIKQIPSSLEKEQLDKDTYFPADNSIIIVDGFEFIKAKMEEYSTKIKEYNESLKDAGVKYRIKPIHTHKYRQFTYYYFGNYIYEVKDSITESNGPTITDSSLERVINKKKKKSKKKKSENKDNVVWEYHSKFEYPLWHQLLGIKRVVELQMPPKIDFGNIKFHIVMNKQKETNTIIMPYLMYMNQNIKSIFNTCAAYKLN